MVRGPRWGSWGHIFIRLIGVTTILVAGCTVSQAPLSTNTFESPQTYFSTMATLNVEVAYEVGAEPYVGNGFSQPLWNFLKTNLEALFVGRTVEPTVTVPTTLAQMQSFPATGKNTWTSQDILAFASSHRTKTTNATAGNFFVVFFNGYYDSGTGTANTAVLGLQIVGTTVVAIFKPVIVAGAGAAPVRIAKFMEQTTLVHELGHVLGLVNNGLPPVSAHQDSAHGAHCTNTSCTMYWQNEGAAAAKQFATNYILTGSEVIFGAECLSDARTYQP